MTREDELISEGRSITLSFRVEQKGNSYRVSYPFGEHHIVRTATLCGIAELDDITIEHALESSIKHMRER